MNTWPDFLFLRHGQTDWNVAGRFQGQTDIPLNATGIAQAEEAAALLQPRSIDRVVTSPMLRALKTAAIVAEQLDRPLHVEARLTERGFGAFEGEVVKEVKQRLGLKPGERIAGHLPPDAEQWPETVARTQSAVAGWLDTHPHEHILFVSHHGLFAALSEILTGERREGRNAVPYHFSRNNQQWTIADLAPDRT